jgi:hypothetical protein
MECGAAGDCFYYSVLALAELFLPELARKWGNVHELRAKTAEHLNKNWKQINFVTTSHASAVLPIVEVLKARTSSKARTDAAIVKSFATAHARVHTFVEGEMICAFAHFAQRPVLVTNLQNTGMCCTSARARTLILFTGVHIYSAGAPMGISAPEAIDTPFHIWCTGGHYQAIVPLTRVYISRTAAESFAFKESNTLNRTDVLLRRR